MATTTFHEYTGDGSDKTFDYSFPTYFVTEVKVQVDGVEVNNYTVPSYATSGTKTVTFDNTTGSVNSTVCESSGAPKTGLIVRVYRDTLIDSAKATYTAGASFKASDLNDNQTQILRALQEQQFNTETTVDYRDNSITGAKIKNDVIDSQHYAADSIDTEHYAPLSVDTAALAGDAINGDKIANTSIDSEHYVVGSIDTAHLANDAVNTDKLADDSVETDRIKNLAVTTGKLANESVTSAKIENATITAADIANDTITATQIAAGTITKALLGTDIIDGTKIGNDSIDSEHYVAGSIDNEHLANNAVGTDELADNSVTSIKIVNGTITGTDIAASTITHTNIANEGITGAKIENATITKDEIADDTIATNNIATNAITQPLVGAGGTAGADKVLVYDASEATKWKWADQSGSGGGSSLTVQEEGSSLSTAATTLNFVGANVTASGTGATKTITVSGGGEVTVQDEGSALSTAATTLNFVGSGVTASGTGATKTITISGGGGSTSTDFKYLELKAHNNASGAFSAGAADYELVTKGTTTAITPAQAAALIISISGVIQEPNTGTSIGSNDGFCIDGSSIHFGANLTAHPDFILYLQGAGVASIADNTVTGAKIALGSDAAGDIMYYNGTDYARLPKGSAGQMLQVNSGATAPEWTAAPSGTTNLTNTANGTSLTVESSSGNNTALPAATTSAWGVMTDEDKTKLDGVAASANNYVHPNHSGEVTSTADGATVIADDIVDEANLKISNAGSNGQFLSKQSGNTGGLTWATVAGTITALNNATVNELVTVGSTTTELDAEANLTFQDTTSTGLISGKQITGRGFECPATVSDDWTIAAGNNAMFPGPMTVAANKTVTVPANRTLTIV